jgi:hypothetical protein
LRKENAVIHYFRPHLTIITFAKCVVVLLRVCER